jgi:hypothetical protein
MTQTAIKAQIDAINKATEIAAKSKESALKFLIDAGIIQQEKKETAKSVTKGKK